MNNLKEFNSAAEIVADSMASVIDAALGHDLEVLLAAYDAHARLLNEVALSDWE